MVWPVNQNQRSRSPNTISYERLKSVCICVLILKIISIIYLVNEANVKIVTGSLITILDTKDEVSNVNMTKKGNHRLLSY